MTEIINGINCDLFFADAPIVIFMLFKIVFYTYLYYVFFSYDISFTLCIIFLMQFLIKALERLKYT